MGRWNESSAVGKPGTEVAFAVPPALLPAWEISKSARPARPLPPSPSISAIANDIELGRLRETARRGLPATYRVAGAVAAAALVAPVVDGLYDIYSYQSNTTGRWVPTADWAPYTTLKCSTGIPPTGASIYYALHFAEGLCGLGGQAEPNAFQWSQAAGGWGGVPAGNHTIIHVRCTADPGGPGCADPVVPSYTKRYTWTDVYWTTLPAPITTDAFEPEYVQSGVYAPAAEPMLNPNVMRTLPGPYVRGVGTPVSELALAVQEALAEPALVTVTQVAVAHSNFSGLPPSIGRTTTNEPGTKEVKVRSTLAKVLRVFDAISEGAEVVDSIYDALPKEVKKKHDCNRAMPFIDNAGQYGIDNADCKAVAIYYNLEKVDFQKAIVNIVKNQITDKIYGAAYRALPKNIGAVHNDASKALGKKLKGLLDDIFQRIGLDE